LLPGKELGGEFPVEDVETNQGGLLQVRIDGIALTFSDKKVWCYIFMAGSDKLAINVFSGLSNYRTLRSATLTVGIYSSWRNMVRIFFECGGSKSHELS